MHFLIRSDVQIGFDFHGHRSAHWIWKVACGEFAKILFEVIFLGVALFVTAPLPL